MDKKYITWVELLDIPKVIRLTITQEYTQQRDEVKQTQ